MARLAAHLTLVRAVTEHDMIAAFLAAEVDSPRHGQKLREVATELGLDLSVVVAPDTRSIVENEVRTALLSAYRGWGTSESVFGGLPTESVVWWSARLHREGLPFVEVIQWLVDEYPESFVGRPLGEVCGTPTGAWSTDGERLRRAIDEGRTPAPPILISSPDLDRLVILEGHNRLIGYTRLGLEGPLEVEVIVGLTTRAAEWSEW